MQHIHTFENGDSVHLDERGRFIMKHDGGYQWRLSGFHMVRVIQALHALGILNDVPGVEHVIDDWYLLPSGSAVRNVGNDAPFPSLVTFLDLAMTLSTDWIPTIVVEHILRGRGL